MPPSPAAPTRGTSDSPVHPSPPAISQIVGQPPTADPLRERIQQSAVLLRTLADETAASAAATQLARDLDEELDDGIELSYLRAQDADMEDATDYNNAKESLQSSFVPSPTKPPPLPPAARRARGLGDDLDDGIELSYPQDHDAYMDAATDFSIAKASLQIELDRMDVDPASKRATSLRAAIQLFTKRPRLAHSSVAAKIHLKAKDKARLVALLTCKLSHTIALRLPASRPSSATPLLPLPPRRRFTPSATA